jgi:hypothetical protein
MARRHLDERGIAFRFACKPVRAFPIVAEDVPQRIVCGQRDTNAKGSFLTGCRLIDQIVLMAKVHGFVPVRVPTPREYTELFTIRGTFPVRPT